MYDNEDNFDQYFSDTEPPVTKKDVQRIALETWQVVHQASAAAEQRRLEAIARSEKAQSGIRETLFQSRDYQSFYLGSGIKRPSGLVPWKRAPVPQRTWTSFTECSTPTLAPM